jgi:hypothetical protein
MNPYRIYRDEWARALARQLTAAKYDTFVAMPFTEHFSYRSKEVLTSVIGAAIETANKRAQAKRPFASPERVDLPMGATVITEEIVKRILNCHIFLADVTFENAGVLLETGVALGVKPNRQIVLITQGSHSDLHFDVRNNNVIRYSPDGSVNRLADALLRAAAAFEEQVAHHVEAVTRRLSPEAIIALNYYGKIQRLHWANSLHSESRGPHFQGPDGPARFAAATAELREKDLVWTDYKVGAVPGGDAFGMHATEFGWAVIEMMWPALRRESGSKPRPRRRSVTRTAKPRSGRSA